MSARVMTRSQIRRLDNNAVQNYGLTGLVLMENAGRACVETMRELGVTGPVVICCGKGNNGGDGFVIARHLDARQIDVKVLLCCDPAELRGDAAVNYRILQKTDVPIHKWDNESDQRNLTQTLDQCQWIVDALLGIGAQGTLRAPLNHVIRKLNEQSACRLAVDVPSGLDCDTGVASEDSFRANHTCTFVAAKPGLLREEARRYVGVLHVLDIGIPRKLIQQVAS